MKKSFIALMLIGLSFTTVTAYAQSAKEAILGLKKLQARCQSGISYKEYSNAVADAKFPVNLFMESEEAKESPELLNSVSKAMFHYQYANGIWRYKFSFKTIRHSIDGDNEIGRDIATLYPNAISTYFFGNKRYEIDPLLSTIWREASVELENATKLYANIETDKANKIEKLQKENDKTAEIERLQRENEKLKANAEIERLREENAKLKMQLESIKPKRKK